MLCIQNVSNRGETEKRRVKRKKRFWSWGKWTPRELIFKKKLFASIFIFYSNSDNIED